jgi:hypothetical protein
MVSAKIEKIKSALSIIQAKEDSLRNHRSSSKLDATCSFNKPGSGTETETEEKANNQDLNTVDN